ncbi:MAG: hypothetical protein Q9216_003491 [Gyalolechia sp. 2 TL-2023]
MAASNVGDAIFSTDLGRWPPRDPAMMPPRIILRSDPTEDMEAKIAELQAKYPSHCKAMKAPITNIHDYFDPYDQQLHGQMFLHAVLMEICLHNTMRTNAVLDYSETWARLNPEAFECIHQFELDAFTDDDMEEYGEDFLRDALQMLQLRKTKQDEAAGLGMDREQMQSRDRYQQANTRPFAVFPLQDHDFARRTQRNSSAPTSSHLSSAQPRLTPSLPSSTPGLAQAFFPNSPFPPPMQRLENANTRPVEPPLRSAPLYYSRRGEHYSDPYDSGINIARPGYSNTLVTMPPQGLMPGPFSYHRVPAGPRASHHPANRSRTLPRSRAPVYIGPSNDARVLEKEGVPRHRRSFGEGRVNQILPQPYAQQGSYSKAYAPLQPNQTYGFSPERPLREIKYPFPGSANKPNHGVPLESNRPPNFTDREPFRINQHTSISSNSDGLNTFSGRDHAVQDYPLARPGQHQDTFHGSQYAEREGFPDLTPPNRAQRQPKTSQFNSPTAHRFSSASIRPYESTPRTHQRGEHQYDPDSRVHRSERNFPVSDRKVWVGGLLPDTDVTILSRLLEPWGPVSISKILTSKYVKGRPYASHNAFAFADFEMPERAADAIKALNEKYIDDLLYRIFLKPAYVRPQIDSDDGSPRKAGTRTYRRAVDRDNEEQMRASLMSFEADAGTPSEKPVEQLDLTSQKRDQFSAEWPALGMNSSHPGQTQQSSRDVQAHISQDIPNQRASSQTFGLGELEIPRDDKLTNSRSNAATGTTSISAKAAENNITSHKSKTPSPKKRNNQNAAKDECTKGRTAQAKQRKEMLSNLRTEKLNAPASISAPHTPLIIGNNEQIRDDNEISSVSNRKKSSGTDETVDEHSLIPPSTPEDDAEKAATVQPELSGVQVSPVHSNSTHVRRLSSASMILSTDPTSYAQSESSETCTINFQTSSYQDHNGSPQSISMAPSERVDVTKLDHMLGDAATTKLSGTDQAPDTLGQVAVQSSGDRAPSANTIPEPSPALDEVPAPSEKTASTNEQVISLSSVNTELSSSYNPGTITVTPSELPVEIHDEKAEAHLTRDATYSEPQPSGETSSKDSLTPKILVNDDVTPSGHTPLRAPVQPSLDQLSNAQLQPATSTALKRGPLKDPKILVAVPKVLPYLKNKPPSHETRGQNSKRVPETTEPIKMFNETGADDTDAASVSDEPQSDLNAPLASSATVQNGQRTEFPATLGLSGSPVVLTDAEQSSNKATWVDNDGGNIEGAGKLTSVSDLITTIEDDRLDPDTSTPQSFAAAILDLAKDMPVMPPSEQQSMEQQSSEQQPAIQQKKPKTKKGKKKAKKSKTLQTDPTDGNNKSQSDSSAAQKEQPTNVVQVETPFLSDDKQPLPRPTFAIQNHSSMRSRHGQWMRNHSLIPSPNPPVEEKKKESCFLLVVNSTYASPSKEVVTRARALMIVRKETGEQDSTRKQQSMRFNEGHGFDLLIATQAERGVCGNDQIQTAGTETHEIGIRSEGQEPPDVADEATREIRAKELDEYLEKNQKASRYELLDMLRLLDFHQRTDGSEGPSKLPEVALNNLHEMNGPKVEEISSGDEAQPGSPPMAPLKQRKQRMLSSRDTSPAGVPTEDAPKATEDSQNTNQTQDREGVPISAKPVTASFPSTRRTSPERGRFRSVSPVRGLGLGSARPPPNNIENVSPSRKGGKMLSYKQVASTPSFQPGEILEITSKESNQEGKEGQGVTMVRKAGSKDPWRVPSSEQPWGGNNKAKGVPSAEALDAK